MENQVAPTDKPEMKQGKGSVIDLPSGNQFVVEVFYNDKGCVPHRRAQVSQTGVTAASRIPPWLPSDI